MLPTASTNVYELCVNFLPGDDGNGGPRFKIDPSGGWLDEVPAGDYRVAAGWVKISYNSVTRAITAQQNLPANCGGSSSSSSVASSVISSSSSSIASSSKSSSSSSVASSSKSSSSSSVASSSKSSSSSSSSSSSAASSSLGPHYAGEDCASCHVAGGQAEKKIFTISGTVYKATNSSIALDPVTPVHTAASIVIMDEADLVPREVIRVQTDANGNFYSYASLGGRALSDLTPHAFGTAGAEKIMGDVPTTGSCNSCHNRTASRVTAPIFVR